MLSIGEKFPEFKLQACVSIEKDKEFQEISSESIRGKWLIFYAYPKDFTFICPTEIVEFDKYRSDFADRKFRPDFDDFRGTSLAMSWASRKRP